MKHGHFLPEWKIRHHIRLDGNSIHIRRQRHLDAGKCGRNNRHFPKGARNFLPDTENIRAQEDLQFMSLRSHIFGVASIFVSRFAGKTGGATPQDLQDAMKLIRCWPEMSWFLRRRLEIGHPHHYRHANCIKNLWDSEVSKWANAVSRSARTRNGTYPQSPPEWHKPLLFERNVTVYVVDERNQNQEPIQPALYQNPVHGNVYTFKVPDFLTLDRFLAELYYAIYNTRSHSPSTPGIQKLWIYRDDIRNKTGYPRIFQKEAIINDLDFYRKTTLFEHTALLSPSYGLWFKAVLHSPCNPSESTIASVPITNPLAKHRTVKAYHELTKIDLPSEHPQPRDGTKRNKVVRLSTKEWIKRGYHPRVRYVPGKIEIVSKVSHIYSSASEPDTEDEDEARRRSKQRAWEEYREWAEREDHKALEPLDSDDLREDSSDDN